MYFVQKIKKIKKNNPFYLYNTASFYIFAVWQNKKIYLRM